MKKICSNLLTASILCFLVWGCQSQTVELTDSDTPLTMVHPWADCGQGSFIHYRITMAGGKFAEEKQTLVDVKPHQLVFNISDLVDNKWQVKGTVIAPVQAMNQPLAEKVKSVEEMIMIGDKTVLCKVIEQVSYDQQEGNRKTITRIWMSKDVPGGIVKYLDGDTVIMEVIDFEKK